VGMMGYMSEIDIMLRNDEPLELMAKTFYDWQWCRCKGCEKRSERGFNPKNSYTMKDARESARYWKHPDRNKYSVKFGKSEGEE
jgi:hypothetical protein